MVEGLDVDDDDDDDPSNATLHPPKTADVPPLLSKPATYPLVDNQETITHMSEETDDAPTCATTPSQVLPQMSPPEPSQSTSSSSNVDRPRRSHRLPRKYDDNILNY